MKRKFEVPARIFLRAVIAFTILSGILFISLSLDFLSDGDEELAIANLIVAAVSWSISFLFIFLRLRKENQGKIKVLSRLFLDTVIAFLVLSGILFISLSLYFLSDGDEELAIASLIVAAASWSILAIPWLWRLTRRRSKNIIEYARGIIPDMMKRPARIFFSWDNSSSLFSYNSNRDDIRTDRCLGYFAVVGGGTN